MSEEKRILENATTKLEANDFSGAIQDLRQVSMKSLPSRDVLTLLNIAENDERVLFRRQLSEKYPESLHIHMEEIYVVKDRKSSRAVYLCSKALELSDEVSDEIHIRLIRCEAAIRALMFQVFVEDFVFLWEKGPTSVSKQSLHILAGIQNPKIVSALEGLMQNDIFPSHVRQLLELKIRELKLLESGAQNTKS